jgi:hypothetical protein
MNEIIVKTWNQTYTKGINLSTITKIKTLRFADGKVIIADSKDNLQRGVFTLKKRKNVWNGINTRSI